MFKVRSAILWTFVLGLIACPLVANAVTYVQTSDDCTGGCGISFFCCEHCAESEGVKGMRDRM
jgi:hypothetical protein